MPVYFSYHVDPDLYYDIEGLAAPITVNIPVGITNNEAFDLYFRILIKNPPAAWSNTSKDLGAISAGASAFKVFDPTRDLPTLTDGEFDETLTLRIEAYKDSGYTDLYGYAELETTIHFFDSLDAAWTMVDRDTFDDGTVEDWSYEDGVTADPSTWGYGPVYVSDIHYISAPYGLRNGSDPDKTLYKDYTVGAYSKARIVIHYWLESGTAIAIKIGNKLIVPAAIGDIMPKGTWVRVAYALPVNATTRVRVQINTSGDGWLDEIRVIAK